MPGGEAEPPTLPGRGPLDPQPLPSSPARREGGNEGGWEWERLLTLGLVKLVMYHVNYQCDLKMVAGPRKINGNPNSNYVAGVKELN